MSAADRVHRWLDYASTNLHAQVEWLSSGGDYEPGEGWTPPPPPPPRRRPTRDDAYKTLYLQPNSPPDLVRVVFRYLATVHHPDKPGGDEEKMKAINAAYKQLAA
jgi:DnaJ-class molecular chaperone